MCIFPPITCQSDYSAAEPVDAGKVKCSHFAFSSSESVRNPRCSGSASVAFSEQEEGGINDSYRNEVAAGSLGVGV